MHPRLVRAVVTAAVAATSEESRKDLLCASDVVRFQAEDALVDRIVNALAQCDDEQEVSAVVSVDRSPAVQLEW